jgi:hypothetical protein
MAVVVTFVEGSFANAAGVPDNITLAVTNTGASAVNISNIASALSPSGFPGYCGQVAFTPGTSKQVLAGATNYYTFSFSTAGSGINAGTPVAVQPEYSINVVVYSDDATTPVAFAAPYTEMDSPSVLYTQQQIPQSPGWLNFQQPANSAVTLALGF